MESGEKEIRQSILLFIECIISESKTENLKDLLFYKFGYDLKIEKSTHEYESSVDSIQGIQKLYNELDQTGFFEFKRKKEIESKIDGFKGKKVLGPDINYKIFNKFNEIVINRKVFEGYESGSHIELILNGELKCKYICTNYEYDETVYFDHGIIHFSKDFDNNQMFKYFLNGGGLYGGGLVPSIKFIDKNTTWIKDIPDVSEILNSVEIRVFKKYQEILEREYLMYYKKYTPEELEEIGQKHPDKYFDISLKRTQHSILNCGLDNYGPIGYYKLVKKKSWDEFFRKYYFNDFEVDITSKHKTFIKYSNENIEKVRKTHTYLLENFFKESKKKGFMNLSDIRNIMIGFPWKYQIKLFFEEMKKQKIKVLDDDEVNKSTESINDLSSKNLISQKEIERIKKDLIKKYLDDNNSLDQNINWFFDKIHSEEYIKRKKDVHKLQRSNHETDNYGF